MAKRKNIEQMSDEERREYQDKLIDEIRGHVSKSGMTRREELEAMSHDERSQYIQELQADILARLESLFGTQPAPPEPPVKAKPKGKRSKRIERFDNLSDDAQISQLRSLWGAA